MLITGPSGSGKTTYLLEKYLELHPKGLTNNGYFLVPTQEHARRILDLALEKIPVLFQPNITTFNDFVLSKAGFEPLMETEKQLILREICLSDKNNYFSEVIHSGIFYQKLSETITELKQSLITPEILQNIAKTEKLQILQRIYKKYLQKLQETNRFDLEDAYQKVADSSPVLDFLFIDGFNDFTPLQKHLLTKIKTKNLFVGLLADNNRPLLFQNVKHTQEFFSKNLGLPEHSLTQNHRAKTPELKFLQENFLNQNSVVFEGEVKNVQLLTSADRIQEVELIAREIIRLVRQGAAWSDCAIILRQIGGYQELIQEVFRRYDIPVVIYEGAYLHKIRFIDWLLKLWNITPENIDEFCSFGFASNNLNQDSIKETTENLQKAQNGQEVFEILDKFIRDNNIFSDLETNAGDPVILAAVREAALAYKRLQTVLKKIPTPIAGTTLEQLIRDALTQELVKLHDEPGDQVQVYDALLARQKDYRFIFLANLNMQSFPVRPKEDIFLNEEDRLALAKLGYPLRTITEKIFQEDFLFYQAICRAQEKLYLTRACTEISGKILTASWYLNEIKKLFPKLPEQKRTYANILPNEKEALSLNEYRRAILTKIFQHYEPSESLNLGQQKELFFIRDILLRWRDVAELRKFGETAKKALESLQKISVSELIDYSNCGFPYFFRSVLEIIPEEEPTLAQYRGNFIHAFLEKALYNENEKINFFKPEVFKEYFPNLHPRQLQIEAEKLKLILQIFCAQEEAILKKRKIIKTEENLCVELEGWQVKGRVDRIDEQNGEKIIVDYKTGRLPEMSIKKIEKGQLIQVLVYALLFKLKFGEIPYSVEYKQPLTLKTKELFLTVINKEIIFKAEKLIKEYLKDIREGKFYTSRGNCNLCDYKLFCGIKREEREEKEERE